jgi:transcriptional regulator
MYAPEPFNVSDQEEILNFIKAHPFALLVQNGDNEPIATHLPFLITKEGNDIILEAHIALANPQSQLIRNGKTALIIFQGPHAYVSSSVYHHQNVPTWNYQSIHTYGTIKPLTDDELNIHLKKVVDHFESDRKNPVDTSSLPNEMLNSYRKEILGFRITVYKLEAAYKLSQNRNSLDHQAIVNDLSKDPKNERIVREMNRFKPD